MATKAAKAPKASKSKQQQVAQQPLILRAHRLMEAFAKSDDERDFYIDRVEGFIIFGDLDKSQEELDALEKELSLSPERYCMIPKLTSYEAKKIMEGFVNEKVYDIDTKEKLLDIIQSKEARTNFLEFIYDHHSELEKWQQYYQERSRIRIIEWLRQQHFHFVFEEDLEFARSLLEKLKQALFDSRPSKEVDTARKILVSKAKSYYSNEALNPRPKRGRPPKQAIKQEVEPQITTDIYLTVPNAVRPFLYIPEITSAAGIAFSADFDAQGQLAARRQHGAYSEPDTSLASLQQKLAALRQLTSHWTGDQTKQPKLDMDAEEEEEEEFEEMPSKIPSKRQVSSKGAPVKSKGIGVKENSRKIASSTKESNRAKPKPAPQKNAKKPTKPSKPVPEKRPKPKRIMPIQSKGNSKPVKKAVIKKPAPKNTSIKKVPTPAGKPTVGKKAPPKRKK